MLQLGTTSWHWNHEQFPRGAHLSKGHLRSGCQKAIRVGRQKLQDHQTAPALPLPATRGVVAQGVDNCGLQCVHVIDARRLADSQLELIAVVQLHGDAPMPRARLTSRDAGGIITVVKYLALTRGRFICAEPLLHKAHASAKRGKCSEREGHPCSLVDRACRGFGRWRSRSRRRHGWWRGRWRSRRRLGRWRRGLRARGWRRGWRRRRWWWERWWWER